MCWGIIHIFLSHFHSVSLTKKNVKALFKSFHSSKAWISLWVWLHFIPWCQGIFTRHIFLSWNHYGWFTVFELTLKVDLAYIFKCIASCLFYIIVILDEYVYVFMTYTSTKTYRILYIVNNVIICICSLSCFLFRFFVYFSNPFVPTRFSIRK